MFTLKFLTLHNNVFEVFPLNVANFERVFVRHSSLKWLFDTNLFLQSDELLNMLDLFSSKVDLKWKFRAYEGVIYNNIVSSCTFHHRSKLHSIPFEAL